MQLRVAEQYITSFGLIARTGNTLVIPSNLSDVGSMLALAMNVLKSGKPGEPVRPTSAPRPAGAPPPLAPPRP